MCNSALRSHILLTSNTPEDSEILRFYFEKILVPAFQKLPENPLYIAYLGKCIGHLGIIAADQKAFAFLLGETSLSATYYTSFGKITLDMINKARDLNVSIFLIFFLLLTYLCLRKTFSQSTRSILFLLTNNWLPTSLLCALIGSAF